MERTTIYTLTPPKSRPSTAPEVVDYVLSSALRMKASDIHIGVNQSSLVKDACLLRFRVHGKLQPLKSDFLQPLYKEVVARLKVLANLNTADSGVPQDGQISVSAPEGRLVLRISTVPSLDFEEVVIRIQRAPEKTPSLDQLLMTRSMQGRLAHLIQQKSGLIIVDGPAGSGKTTTIYSMIGALSSPERKIITAEDPVEMRLPYVSHMQISQKTGFGELARTFLRQDSDVIFIGEIRDAESAEIAVQLAQTGHLVLTTLHTRDAAGVIPRLRAFDVHPSFISGTLIGSLNQRLVPRLCPGCRVESMPDAKMLDQLQRLVPYPEGTKFYSAGPGCASCTTGHVGRMPIFELFLVDSEVADLIARERSMLEIVAAARKRGMRSLAEDALARVYGGYADLASVQPYVFSADFV